MIDADLEHHACPRSESWWEHDARGIPLCRVCNVCRKAKLATFRADVLRNPHYECDEPIEEDY